MKKLNRVPSIVIALVTLFSCVSMDKKNYRYENLIGTWILTKKQVNYPELTFNNDKTCIFTSMGDTIYRFKYDLKRDELILEDMEGTIKKNRILKLTKEELVFESLWENKTKQDYIKKRF